MIHGSFDWIYADENWDAIEDGNWMGTIRCWEKLMISACKNRRLRYLEDKNGLPGKRLAQLVGNCIVDRSLGNSFKAIVPNMSNPNQLWRKSLHNAERTSPKPWWKLCIWPVACVLTGVKLEEVLLGSMWRWIPLTTWAACTCLYHVLFLHNSNKKPSSRALEGA